MDGWDAALHFTSLRFASPSRVESSRGNDRLNPERACVRVCVFVCSCARARKEKNGDSVEEDLVSWRLILHLTS